MNGIVEAIEDGNKAVFIRLESPSNFKIGEQVTVNKTKKIRTLNQNALYWVYLVWCVHPRGGDLQSHGYFSIDGLHENIKAWIKLTHPQDFKIDKRFTTTTLTRQEFSRFFDIVNQELMVEYFGVDTSPFWKDHEKFIGWQTTNPGGMDEYLNERMPF